MLQPVGNPFSNWRVSLRRSSSPRTGRNSHRFSSSGNETGSEASSMYRREPYPRGMATRSAGASSSQSQDNLSLRAMVELGRERELYIEELVTELIGIKEENRQAMVELKECRQRFQDLKQDLAAREKDLKVQEELVRSHNKRHKALRSKAEKEINVREQSIASMSRAADHLTSEKILLETKNKQKTLHIAQLQKEAETQKSHITELTGTILQMSSTASQLTSEKILLETQNKQQALHIAQLQEEAETQKSHITELTGTILQMSSTASQLTSEKILLETQSKQQALHIAQLQDEAETQKSHITELTGAILHSSTITTPSRDDDYFAGEFARLTGSIRHWVLRYFEPHGVPALSYGDLSETLAQSLAKTVLTPITPEVKIKISRKEIEAGISRMLTERLFNQSFVLMVFDWPSIPPAQFPKVTDREIQKWRSQTASILSQHSSFEVRFADAVTSVTEDLQNCFIGHVKAGMEPSRLKALRTIVEQAARLEIEISRELSKFRLPYIRPGLPYRMEYQDDRSGVVDASEDDSNPEDGEEKEEKRDEEKKPEARRGKEFIVDTVLFPPVVRLEFDDNGKFKKTPIIIRKGVVIAIRSLKGGLCTPPI